MTEKKSIPAFPHQKKGGDPYWGMDLRDWFAGMALPELIKINENVSAHSGAAASYEGILKAISKQSYDVADAMLKERSK